MRVPKIPCVPEILTLMYKNIKLIIFVDSLALTEWLITQKIKAPAKYQGSNVHYRERAHVCRRTFVKATILGTHTVIFTKYFAWYKM